MNEENIKYFLFAGIFLAFVAIMSGGNSGSKRTDGVFESAMSKIDSGEALTSVEQQRVSDIINWCNQCSGPKRSCSH